MSNSLRISSYNIGKGSNFFANMKKKNHDKYLLVQTLGSNDLALGYDIYIQAKIEEQDIFLDLYNDLEKVRKVSDFCRKYNIPRSTMRNYGEIIIYSILSYKVYIRIKKINIQIEEYIRLYPVKI